MKKLTTYLAILGLATGSMALAHDHLESPKGKSMLHSETKAPMQSAGGCSCCAKVASPKALSMCGPEEKASASENRTVTSTYKGNAKSPHIRQVEGDTTR